ISARKVYYVVIESYNDLRSAEDATRVMPDALSPCIFKANEGGRTLYRLCDGCYYSRKDALEHASLIRQYLERDAWVWESNGTAVCVNQAVGLSGELVDISPK
ncbi:MAG: SPOR domain-containing protein, partial [Prevotella sp.]|nr:SPOR domain-containing protein [Prevotella sp.]